MAYNTKAIKTDVNGNPISQYYNPETDEYEPVEGASGGNKVILYNEDGTPNNSLSLGEILDKLDQLKGTVIDEETRKQNEQIRQQNEQQRIDLYNALKDLDVSQYELRLQNVENQVNIDNFLLEEWDESVIPLPSNATNGQINEIKIFGNTEAEEDNVKSTFGAIRLKSVGKNLFDGKLELGSISPTTGENTSSNLRVRSGFIPVIGGNTYRLSSLKFYYYRMFFYDKNRNFISAGGIDTSYEVAPSDGYVRFTVRNTSNSEIKPSDVESVQLEKGEVPTPYEPYKESTMYVVAKDEEGNILELHSLPNGVKDEIDVANRKLIKRIGEKANVSSGTVINFADMAEGGTYFAWNENGETETGNKGDILGIDATVLTYQLAQPIEIPIEVFGNLQSYENGTVYVDIIIPRVDFYTPDGIYLENEPPIKEIDSLYLVNKENGYLTELDISKAFIFPDGKGFTHPDLFTGALVDWDYIPDIESTIGSLSMVLPTNLKASVNSLLDAENKNKKDIEWNHLKLGLHIEDKNNPHNITPDQIGAETPAGAQAKVDALAGEGNTKTVRQLDDELSALAQQISDLLSGGEEYTATLQNGWSGNLTYRKNLLGQVVLSGQLTAGDTAPNTQICVLPAGFRPKHMLAISAYNGTQGVVGTAFQLSTGGILYPRSGANINLNSGNTVYIHIIYSTI